MGHRCRKGRRRLVPILAASLLAPLAMLSGVAAGAPRSAAPPRVSKVSAVATSGTVTLRWTNPKRGTFTGVMIRRSTDGIGPATVREGTLIARVPASRHAFVDRTVLDGTLYGYSLFTYKGTSFSGPVRVQVVTKLRGTIEAYRGGSYGFDAPDAIAAADGMVWVANALGDSVTVMSASNGAYVRTLSGPGYDFDKPVALAFDGTHLWIVSETDSTVTEIDASSGDLVQTLSGGSYGFSQPTSIGFDGSDLWVADAASVTEIDASSGSWIRTLSGGSYGFDGPLSVSYGGGHMWVTNEGGNSVTEMDAPSGAWVQTLSGSSYDFAEPSSSVDDGTHLWVTNWNSPYETELNASSGSLIRVLSAGNCDFYDADAASFDGIRVWVLNTFGQSGVTEVDASTGACLKTLYFGDGNTAIASNGGRQWVADLEGDSVYSFPDTI